MKRALMLTLAAGGLLLATSGDAAAQSWRSGRSNGFGVSLNFGSPNGVQPAKLSQHQLRLQ